MKLTEKLWLTDDRKTVVKDGDKRAAFLLGLAGQEISDKHAKQLGLVPGAELKHAPVDVNPDPPVAHRDAPHTAHAPHKK